MKFAILIYGDETQQLSPQEMEASLGEWWSYDNQLSEAGAKLAGEALQPTATGKTVRVRNGKERVVDGPFAETKEQFGGFYLIDVKDMDEAVAWGARCPGAKSGTIEVRPIQEFDQPQ
jgi:hypothetical protein